MVTKRIMLLMQHDTNCRLLEKWVQEHYSLVDSSVDGFADVDLIIVDKGGFRANYSALSTYKEQINPLFLPILLVSNDKIDYQQQAIWQVLDGAIRTPIDMHYLKLQLDVLLRTRHLSQQALEQSQTLTKLRQGIESSSDAIIIVEDGRVTHINQAAIDCFGIELNQSNADLYLQEIDTSEKLLLAELSNAEKSSVNSELVLCRSDGSLIPMLVRIDQIAEQTGSYIISCTDISNQRDAQASEHRQRLIAETLQDTAMILTSTLDIQEVFERILANIERLIPLRASAICILENGFVTIARSQGYHPAEIEELSDFFNQNTLHDLINLNAVFDSGQRVEITTESPIRVDRFLSSGCLIITPIRLNTDTIGLILIELDEVDEVETTEIIDVNHLNAFAAQAAIAIQNARLYAKSQNVAAVEERERLARDFHDSVTQTLFSASMIAESIKRSLDDAPEDIIDLLDELHLLTRGALAETRTVLLELKPTKLLETDLSDLLRQLAESIWSRKQIVLTVDIAEECSTPLRVKVAFYRIAQEALHNIVKHSKATTVKLTYRGNDTEATMTISDNGIGFENPTKPGLGLTNMKQRAEKLAATLDIISSPLVGTTIHLIWHNQDLQRGEKYA